MAKAAKAYTEGWKHEIEIDGVKYESMGLTWTPGGSTADVMTNNDGGWEKEEVQTRNVELGFTMPLKAALIATPPIEYGDIVPMKSWHNGNLKYDGLFLCTGAKVNATNKAVSTLDVTVKNYGDVTPAEEAPGAPPTVLPAPEEGPAATTEATTTGPDGPAQGL